MRIIGSTTILSRIAFLAAFCVLSLAPGAFAEDEPDSILGARYPSISPDGETIAFTYLGDLWRVPAEGGRATRLTVHPDFDGPSSWSPDGKWLAFSSTREYNSDVFVMPASGGVPNRLTYHADTDIVCGWSPDGKRVLFCSNRGVNPLIRPDSLFTVSPDGGLPIPMINFTANYGVLSPSGDTLAFVRGFIPSWLEGYSGSDDRDIWLTRLDGSPAAQFTDFEGNDVDPMWSEDSSKLYFLSDRDGVTNVWSKPVVGGEADKVTSFEQEGVVHAQIALNGSIIVCELHGEVYRVDPATGEHRRVIIQAPSDLKRNQVELETFRSKASEFALSKDAKQIAFVVHGEVFAMSASEPKEWTRLTETAAREDGLSWGPKGKKLAFCSDRNGNRDLFVMESTDSKEKRLSHSRHRRTTPLAATTAAEYSPVWAPDGKKVAYLVGQGDLWVADSSGKEPKLIAEGPAIEEVMWGPDGSWLVFSKLCAGWQSEIFIVSSDGEELHNITKNPARDFNPCVSEDGTKVVFLSHRGYRWQNTYEHDVWHVFLTKRAEEEYRARRDGDVEDEATKKPKKSKKKEVRKEKKKKRTLLDLFRKKKKPERKGLEFDFEDIHTRAMRISTTKGSAWALSVSPDGKTYAFGSDAFGDRNVYAVDEFGKQSRQLTDSGLDPREIIWHPNGKSMFVLSEGGTIAELRTTGQMRPVPFTAKMTIDHKGERLQMFNETWGMINRFFYDKDFHGVDWAAVREKYLPLLETVSTTEEFVMLLSQMVGELGTSHSSVRAPRDPDFKETGQLGLRFDPAWKGRGLRVSGVVPDGPTDLPGSEIHEGDVILSIDGLKIDKMNNPFDALMGKVDELVDLEVLKDGRGKPRLVTVKAWSKWDISQKMYLAWVASRKALVEKLSGGKVGYVHLRWMSPTYYQEFLNGLTHEMADKEALIVDVRFNGGGYGELQDALLSVLGRDVYFYFEDRDKSLKVMQPRFNWRKPIAVVMNEYSMSAAETFPYSFRHLGIGKLIGVPTPGGVVCVSGYKRLLDGTLYQVPQWGSYTLEGEELEGVGVKPDIYVENPPEQDFSMTSDDQLKKAVEELLRQVNGN